MITTCKCPSHNTLSLPSPSLRTLRCRTRELGNVTPRAPLARAAEVTACCGEEMSFRKAFAELGLTSQAARISQVTRHVVPTQALYFLCRRRAQEMRNTTLYHANSSFYRA
jgi:hypothetical protein